MDRRKKVFHAHSLPSPEYRQYLVAYIASCFHAPIDYIEKKPHCYPDPLRVLDLENEFSRIFEVRFVGDLQFSLDQVLAVFLPGNRRKNVMGRLHEQLQVLRDAKVAVRYYNGSQKDFRRKLLGWIRPHLNIAERDEP